ncbi:hypothetical protein Micbo1qcDRAFT_165082 [Microdochium bolleyi]|uniref:S-adenosyl-L-methionine-dependent methyltransferase n=1 Tax=Microdochium bolleyi TaxID=196109 RepID=A0A136IXX3_9PEZI|nr:hypothetical protein Micbo1qcDRAFT_165082 [Microdochium bolleyi]
MSRWLAAPARALLPRCRCVEIRSIFSRETRRNASSSKASRSRTPPSKSAPAPPPQKSKPLPYKAQAPPPPPPPPDAGSSSTANNSEAQPVADLVRQRFMPIFGFGAAALCLGAILASGVYHWNHDEVVRYPPGKEPQVPTGRASIQSPVEFDLHLDKSEWRLGITSLRRRLAEHAHGHVLEVAIGAGRNLEHYDWDRVTESLLASDAERNKLRLARAGWGVNGGSGGKKIAELQDKGLLSFTGIDISPAMLDIAMKRMRGVVPLLAESGALPAKPVWTLFSQHAAKPKPAVRGQQDGGGVEATYALLGDRIRIIQCDAQKVMPRPAVPEETRYYDTVLQTFGLCSVRDPVSLIAGMAGLVRPETGRIVMVEHGLSVWDLVNGLLDRSARGHFERFGCWWNRDVEVIVHDAVRQVEGLEIVAFERPGWLTGGTHLWVELKMSSSSAAAAAAASKTAAAGGGGGRGGDTNERKDKQRGGDGVENPAADDTKTDGWFGLGSFMTVRKAGPAPSSSSSPDGENKGEK